MKKNQFVELKAQEIKEVNGGIFQAIGAAILFQLAMEVLDGTFFSDSEKGYNEVRQYSIL